MITKEIYLRLRQKPKSMFSFSDISFIIQCTAGIGRMVHPPKNDLFSNSDFVTFTIRIVKMYVILVDYDGNAVSLGHMHAGINCIIK